MTTETTMKKEEMLNDFPPKTSERFECLESVLRKALQASQTHFDVDTAMTEVYGDEEVANFGKDTLRVFFDSGLDKIQKQVLQRMATYCRQHNMEKELWKLETLALKLERETEWEQYLEQQDHSSAKNALDQAKLPAGYTADDVVQFQLYEQLSAQETTLQEELAQLEAQVAKLEQLDQKETGSFQEKHEKVTRLTTEMEKAADITSTVTK